jgi:hypothetical protein
MSDQTPREKLRLLFKDRPTLSEFIQTALGENLNDLAAESLNLEQTIFELLNWCEARGKLPLLLDVLAIFEKQGHERKDFETKASQDADWLKLAAQSQRAFSILPGAIAGRVVLKRDSALGALDKALGVSSFVALVGSSGVGKSSIAKTCFERCLPSGGKALWFDANSFDRPDFNAFEFALGLKTSLSDLLSAAPPDSILIIDGLDRLYSDSGFRIAAILLQLANKEASCWKILLTSQAQELARVIDSIERTGFAGHNWEQVTIQPLTPEELLPVQKGIPALSRLLQQQKIKELMGNLKILDLVARRVISGSEIDATQWVGETSLANWFWDSEINKGRDKVARGKFVRSLAQLQADRLTVAISVDDLEMDLAPLASLSEDKICIQTQDDKITFAHDLYGDWARLRLIENNRDNLKTFLQGKQDSPLWHRSIRLYAQYLLEQNEGTENWHETMRTLGDEQPGIIHDLFLEAPVFATNPWQSLESICDKLLANRGLLLRRLLNRFLIFATIPIPNAEEIAKKLEIRASVVRATLRMPYWLYWPGMLHFLHTHKNEVVTCAPDEVAKIVELWLRVPTTFLRREAAELGVLLGRFALQAEKNYQNHDWNTEQEHRYRCTLAAIQEFTEEVIDISLDACRRKKTTETETETPKSPIQFRRGRHQVKPTKQWPDGPNSFIDKDFRNVALHGDVLLPLFKIHPETAREIILALLIDPPRQRDVSNWQERRGLALDTIHAWQPALYTHGPFLSFLQSNFAQGLEVIVRLVDFATERWYSDLKEIYLRKKHQQESTEPLPKKLKLTFNGQEYLYIGNEKVYCWPAGRGNPPEAIEVALMALEQYFYLQLQEGNNVEEKTIEVLKRGQSVSFLKVVCDVAKKQPALFEGPLRILLSVPELYSWDIKGEVHERSHFLIGAFNQDKQFTEKAKQFHEMEHRKADLRIIAIWFMYYRKPMRDYFDTVREEWRKVLQDQPDEELERMEANLDFENYEIRTNDEGRQILVSKFELKRQERLAEERQLFGDRLLTMGLPTQCRRIIDEGKVLSAEELEALWKQWIYIRALSLDSENPHGYIDRLGDDFANAIAGGIAVFFRHQAWLEQELARVSECNIALQNLLGNSPTKSSFLLSHDSTEWTWDCFIAEALPSLWFRNLQEPNLRKNITQIIFYENDTPLRILFAQCAKHRTLLGDDFSRLRRLALEWSYVKEKADFLRRIQPTETDVSPETVEKLRRDLDEWKQERVCAFVDGSMELVPARWEECKPTNKFSALDDLWSKYNRKTEPSLSIIRYSHEWLPFPERAQNETERKDCLNFLHQALPFITKQLKFYNGENSYSHPNENESWVLNFSAQAMLQMRNEEKPEVLWQPVLEAPTGAHAWVETFVRTAHWEALRQEILPATYPPLFRAMLHKFLENRDKRKWSPYDKVGEVIIGIDRDTHQYWQPRHQKLVRELADAFDLWEAQISHSSQHISAYARWLCLPAATERRLASLSWFLKSVKGATERSTERVEEPIALLLNQIWIEQQPQLANNEQYFGQFKRLLRWLGDRQNILGLELIERIGGLV